MSSTTAVPAVAGDHYCPQTQRVPFGAEVTEPLRRHFYICASAEDMDLPLQIDYRQYGHNAHATDSSSCNNYDAIINISQPRRPRLRH